MSWGRFCAVRYGHGVFFEPSVGFAGNMVQLNVEDFSNAVIKPVDDEADASLPGRLASFADDFVDNNRSHLAESGTEFVKDSMKNAREYRNR